ncbi:DUF4965 domain-containing protein [Fulvivirgaceae bacterium PWU5]|uniref:DUF4965 domain-containing protein n=1 Tax=Dawidia cretensis TaxID=2782350 RepID=A0AAP2GSR4_9BACT|nr:glutaminase family protein [Dawidia cretensis]MBT1711494.1 DUF4965 domain-containing protein [Dawidia cretensis]
MRYQTKYVWVAMCCLTWGLISCDKSKSTTPADGATAQFTSAHAPAYPLVTIDPYTSAWSMADNLYDDAVRHWTGEIHALTGAVRVDGTVYRFLGKEKYPLKALVPMAKDQAWEGQYTTKAPAAGWEKPEYKPTGAWKSGKAAFGTKDFNSSVTVWDADDIWVRRTFTLSEIDSAVYLIYSHDDNFELYLNGQEIVNTGAAARMDVLLKIDASLLRKDGPNILAGHCKDTGGLAYLDFGLYTNSAQPEVFKQTAKQDGVAVSATQTRYDFTCGGVGLEVTFRSPLLPTDLNLLSRPISFVDYSVTSNDGQEHAVEVYFEMTPSWAVNSLNQEVVVTEGKAGNVAYLRAGTTEQPVLKRKGDNVRIDWGYAYLVSPQPEQTKLGIGTSAVAAKEQFSNNGDLAASAGETKAKLTDSTPAMSYVHNLGKVGSKASSGYIMIAYDDVSSIQYFGDNRPAWWKQTKNATIDDILNEAQADYQEVKEKCNAFDKQVYAETLQAGGKQYADICVLAFRQSIAAHKLTQDSVGNILFLSKENFSNGSIGTVDVTYPSAPLFLKYNPELLKGMMNPIFYYSESGKWKKPFAAHDVGTYPLANGQTYGEDMPVEECGNMLVLTGAIAKREGNANYAKAHWKVLTTWAGYLRENGLDPANQLCTDDFAGHLAHNTNLSIKAIMGIASYGMLAEMLNKQDTAKLYKEEAARMAEEWVKMANDGDHYRLTFDQPGTWSQKYNMVWDKLLGFNIFPKEVAERELKYYLTKQNTYGLPLDSRRTYTKSDWIVWTATLANDSTTFKKIIDPLYTYVTGTPTRVPMSDWYETTDGKQVGFQARSVVGGYFIKLLEEAPKVNQ